MTDGVGAARLRSEEQAWRSKEVYDFFARLATSLGSALISGLHGDLCDPPLDGLLAETPIGANPERRHLGLMQQAINCGWTYAQELSDFFQRQYDIH
jgi:hypothetical protein